jgi:hypothetical protein
MRPCGSTSGPVLHSACTGKRLPAAPAALLEGPGAMSMHTHPYFPACIASTDTLANASQCMFFCSLHRRVSSASNASCHPKTEHGSPIGAVIDLHASRTVNSGVGGEEGPSIDGSFDGLDRDLPRWRQRPTPTVVGLLPSIGHTDL